MTRYLLVPFVVCAALGTFAAVDPFHLRHGATYTGVFVLLALVLGTVLLVRVLPGRPARIVGGVIGGLLVAGWIGLIALTIAFAGPEAETVTGSGGQDDRVELVVVRGYAFADPVYSLRLRAGGGPFAQESLVWQGLASAPPPSVQRLVGPEEVRLITSGGCVFRSTFDRTTLAVEPIHYALRADGC